MLEIRLPVSNNEEVLQIANILVKNLYTVNIREANTDGSSKKIRVVNAYTDSEIKK